MEGEPPTNVCIQLRLHISSFAPVSLTTSIYEAGIDILKMCLHTKNELLGHTFKSLEH